MAADTGPGRAIWQPSRAAASALDGRGARAVCSHLPGSRPIRWPGWWRPTPSGPLGRLSGPSATLPMPPAVISGAQAELRHLPAHLPAGFFNRFFGIQTRRRDFYARRIIQPGIAEVGHAPRISHGSIPILNPTPMPRGALRGAGSVSVGHATVGPEGVALLLGQSFIPKRASAGGDVLCRHRRPTELAATRHRLPTPGPSSQTALRSARQRLGSAWAITRLR